MNKAFLTCALFLCGFLVISETSACEVGLAQYKLLRLKMSYADAVKIAGCDGEEISSCEAGGFRKDTGLRR